MTIHALSEIQAVVVFLDKISLKMPDNLNVDKGHLKSPTTFGQLGLLPKCVGLCPRQPDGENSEVSSDLVLILICICLLGLPFHRSVLPKLVSVAVLSIGPMSELKDYVESELCMPLATFMWSSGKSDTTIC